MIPSVAEAYQLPSNLAITDRSRKFYDGTYTWDSDGFTDEHGVYREFDCLDPLTRAPTPMPPIFLDGEVDDKQLQTSTDDLAQSTNLHTATPLTMGEAILEPAAACSVHADAPDRTNEPKTPRTIHRLAMEILSYPKPTKSSSQGEASRDYHDNSFVAGNLEAIASEQTDKEAGTCIDNELRRAQSPEQSLQVNMPDTPPESPCKAESAAMSISPSSTLSSLSTVPSNLSEQGGDVGTKIKGSAAINESGLPSPDMPAEASSRSKTTVTTRGAVQKITKGNKKAAINPPRRADNSVEEFTLLELHSGAFLRNGPRRSTRNAKSNAK